MYTDSLLYTNYYCISLYYRSCNQLLQECMSVLLLSTQLDMSHDPLTDTNFDHIQWVYVIEDR